MAKKYRNLINLVVDPDNMRCAYRNTSRGKRRSPGYLEFKEYAELNLFRLADEIRSGSYHPDPTRSFWVYEPKPRLITAISFRDRVAQHALVNVIGPIFEATFLPRTFACRVGMGTHIAAVQLQSEIRRLGDPLYVLKTDFSKYFHSIDRRTLHDLIERKISCIATISIIKSIVPPDGLGLPIGSLTSQLFANVYGGQVDRFIQCELGQKNWFRYMDDIVVLGRDPGCLRGVKCNIEEMALSRLGLRLSKWSVAPASRGVNFLGYRIWASHKLLRRQSVTRARRKVAEFHTTGDVAALHRFLGAWLGHASWADSHNLRRTLRKEILKCKSSTHALISTH